MRLKEAATSSSPQSYDSDSNSNSHQDDILDSSLESTLWCNTGTGFQEELFIRTVLTGRTSCLEYNSVSQNPATLIWVQVTQIFKKKNKKRFKFISENGRQKVPTALHCAVFLFCFSPLWPVAPLSGAWHLLQTDRIKTHSLSLLLAYLNTSQESSDPHGATASAPAHRAEILLVLPSCSASEQAADGDTDPCLSGASVSLSYQPLRTQMRLLDGLTASRLFGSSSSSAAEVDCVIAEG